MDVAGWTFQVLIWLLAFVPGAIAIRTGWVFSFGGGDKAVSPRPWGWGHICAGVGATIATGPVHRHLGSMHLGPMHLGWAGSHVGVGLMMIGLWLFTASRRTHGPKR